MHTKIREGTASAVPQKMTTRTALAAAGRSFKRHEPQGLKPISHSVFNGPAEPGPPAVTPSSRYAPLEHCGESFLLFLSFTPPLFARDWRVANFQDTINVTADGSTSVRERLTLSFVGEWHGIHRTIPVEYPGPSGTNYTLFLNVENVTDGNGQKLKYESSTAHGYRDLKIFIPNAVDTTRTVEISYIVRNAIRHFEDPGGHDEFYWNVTGNDWTVPIDHVSALVMFPNSAAGELKAQAFTGAYGSTEHEVTASVDGASVSFESTTPLPFAAV